MIGVALPEKGSVVSHNNSPVDLSKARRQTVDGREYVSLRSLAPELQLRLERAALRFSRRMHVVVVEPGLAHSHDFRRGEQRADSPPRVIRPAARFVGMHACRRRASGRAMGEGDRALAAGQRLTDHHDVGDSHGSCVGEHGVAVGVERGIAQMTMGVY